MIIDHAVPFLRISCCCTLIDDAIWREFIMGYFSMSAGDRMVFIPPVTVRRVEVVERVDHPHADRSLVNVYIDRQSLEVSHKHSGHRFRLVLSTDAWTSVSDPFLVLSKQPATETDAEKQFAQLRFNPRRDTSTAPSIPASLAELCKEHIMDMADGWPRAIIGLARHDREFGEQVAAAVAEGQLYLDR